MKDGEARAAWRPWAWAAAVAAAAWAPGLAGAVPCLRALRGPLLLVPFALAAGATLQRLGRLRWPAALDRPAVSFALAALLLGAAGQWYTSALRASGDEPHYLLMAQSLWREGDLDLRDNLERGDFLEYTPGPVAPHYGNPRRDGRPFPAHSPGLPFVLAPLYALGGRRACVVLLALLGAALAGEARALARQAGADLQGARLAWAATLGPPAFYYAFHVYTEMPSALAIALALRLLLLPTGAGGAAAAALLIAALPWLHLKLALAAAALAGVGLWRLRGRARIVFVAVLAVAGALFLAWFQYVFGRPTPLAIYGGVPPEFSEGSPLRAIVGLLLDRSFGLLPFAPLFLLALAGLPALARTGAGRAHLVLLGCVVVPAVTWRMWWGGQCPPGRFLVPVVGTLATALAVELTRASGRGLARWRGPLLGTGFALALVAIARPGALLLVNRGDRPTRLWSALSGDWPVQRYLPSLVFGSSEDARVAALWLAALAMLLALHVLARRHDRADRAFRSPALALGLLLAVGIGVDAWARPGDTNAAPVGVTATPD